MGSIVRRIAKNPLVQRIRKFLDWTGSLLTAGEIAIWFFAALTVVGLTFGAFGDWLFGLSWPVAATIVLGITGLVFTTVLSVVGRTRQWWRLRAEFPVYVIASAHDNGVDLRVGNKRSKDKFKVQLTSCGMSVSRSLLPRALSWKGKSGEYKMIPRTMEEVARLCDYHVDLTIPLATVTIGTNEDGTDICVQSDFSDFFTDLPSTDFLFQVVVVGHNTPAKSFTVILRMKITKHGCQVTTEVSPLPGYLRPLGGMTSMRLLKPTP